jgi:hypothetical protein
MSEKPIIFSGPMIRAIIDGRKTMTRRVAKLTDSGRLKAVGSSRNWHPDDPNAALACPYGQPGERLWVREAWAPVVPGVTAPPFYYRADVSPSEFTNMLRWRPSIHMPRHASRITLEITGVRVERVQEITGKDAVKEGIESVWPDGDPSSYFGAFRNYEFETAHPKRGTVIVPEKHQLMGFQDATRSFRSLWDSLNAKRGFGWEVNPFVWVVEFKRVQ